MYNSIAGIIEKNKQLGQHFFSEGAMRFFNSEIESGVLKGRYFITSERFDEKSPKRFTIRKANDYGSIDTVGKFQEHKTLRGARAAVRKL